VSAHQELAKVEAETGDYAPNTVTPTEPEAEGADEDAEGTEDGVAVENGTDPVAELAEDTHTPAEQVETERYKEPEPTSETPRAVADPVEPAAELPVVENEVLVPEESANEVLVPENSANERQEDTTPAA
jgi:hypothetical protein